MSGVSTAGGAGITRFRSVADFLFNFEYHTQMTGREKWYWGLLGEK